mmetsp:Transcript_29917/g.64489  ORF Transcript_29917/g.64489 Transcript_29917/m.64489 type:complete len:256 (+) Transcript_29917:1039-1806(+)
MHAENTPLGQEVVHDGEHTFLHFPSVLRSENHHLPGSKVQRHRGAGAHAFSGPVARESACVVNRIVWGAKVGKFFCSRANQHVVHEEGVIGTAGNNSNLVAKLRVPPGKTIKDIQSGASVQVVDCSLSIDLEAVLTQGQVHCSPPNIVLRGWLHDHTFVQGGAPCLGTRKGGQRARGQNGGTFLIAQSLIVQGPRAGIMVDGFRLDAKVVQNGHVCIRVVRKVLWQLPGYRGGCDLEGLCDWRADLHLIGSEQAT